MNHYGDDHEESLTFLSAPIHCMNYLASSSACPVKHNPELVVHKKLEWFWEGQNTISKDEENSDWLHQM